MNKGNICRGSETVIRVVQYHAYIKMGRKLFAFTKVYAGIVDTFR
jgi:hypothetical protein